MFGSHWSNASVDLKYLKSRNAANEESCNFMNGSAPFYISNLPSLVTIDTATIEK